MNISTRDGSSNCEILEAVFRHELRLAGERWRKAYKEMSDKERMVHLGRLAARRLISKEVNERCRKNDVTEDSDVPASLSPDLEGTQGSLEGRGVGGGRRIIKGTNSF